MKKGVIYACVAYFIWGLFPIYFTYLDQVPALQTVMHRILWSFLLLAVLVVARKEWAPLRATVKNPKLVLLFLVSSLLITINWLTYVYGVSIGMIVETSLGYFINPLVSVMLGVVVLRERLRPLQWLPVGLAALGVIYLTIEYGRLPWIALVLAFSFGLYGLVKKTAPLGSFHSLTMETGIMFLPSLLYLLSAEFSGAGAFGHAGLLTTILLALTGPVTVVPLLLFGSAARQIDLSMMGLLQYITPTLQFLIGVLIYKEPFTTSSLIGFAIIWAALIILWAEGTLQRQRRLALARKSWPSSQSAEEKQA